MFIPLSEIDSTLFMQTIKKENNELILKNVHKTTGDIRRYQ